MNPSSASRASSTGSVIGTASSVGGAGLAAVGAGGEGLAGEGEVAVRGVCTS